jgi:hypothetical protein
MSADNKPAIACFREEIRFLTAKLEDALLMPDSAEETARTLLRDLDDAISRIQDVRLMAPQMRALEDYWLHHIAWCSVLSKEIEKIIILYEELTVEE